MGKKLHSLGDAFGTGAGDVDAVAAVMLRGTTKVPPVDTMGRPGAANGGGFVDQDFGAGWREGRSVIVEGAVELRFGREARVDARWAEQV